MKYSVFILLSVFGLFSVNFAQSGRRVTPAPTPLPASQAEKEADYSESSPRKPRAISVRPTFRVGADGKPTNSQTTQNQTQNSSSPAAATSETDDEVVKVDTNLVTIPISVFDRDGLYIPNLRQSDFKIFENGKEQEIAYFGTSDKPFTVILLIDTSPSTAYKIEEIQQAAIAFVDQLKPQDSVMVIEFDGNVHVLTESTQDRQKIYKAIQKADFGGGTSLYDAVDFSLKKRLSKVDGRKAIILFTDGVDTQSSKANYDSTLDLAEEADALIFPIYYNTFFDTRGGIGSPFPGGQIYTRGTSAQEYAIGKKYLEELSGVTGGRVFRPEATPGGLTAAFEGIAEELRRQYNIGYIPQDDAKAGERKQIKVRVNRPNLVIRSRDSYIVGANETQTKTAVSNKTNKN
jgi:Ca-activated chloride channel homolog